MRRFDEALPDSRRIAAAEGAAEGPDLSIVIPALNDRQNLELLLPALKREVAAAGISAEIIVVDGGSHDGSREAAVALGARVVAQIERGYGGAILAGFMATSAPYVLTMDADMSDSLEAVRTLWQQRLEAAVVIASRYTSGGRAQMSRLRTVLSRLLNRTYRRLLSLPTSDLSSGFRLYQRSALPSSPIVARDFDFLEEIVVRMYADGWRIDESPFHYRPNQPKSPPGRLFGLGVAFLRTLLRMWRLRNSVASADYDYRAFDSPIWLQRYWQRARHRIVLGFLEKRRDVLDVGCGSSRIILDLPSAVGVDVLQNKLRWLKPRHRLLVRGSCMHIPFRDETFSAIINSEVIEHVPDSPDILAEALRVLKPGGILILGTPDYGRLVWLVLEWLYGKVHGGGYAEEHITHFTRETLRNRLRESGFEIMDCRYVGFGEMIFKARKPAAVKRLLKNPAV